MTNDCNHNEVTNIFDFYINDYRDPVSYIGIGLFIGYGFVLIGLSLLTFAIFFTAYLFYTNPRMYLFKNVIFYNYKMSALLFIDFIVGFNFGYYRDSMIDNHVVYYVLVLFVLMYLSVKAYKAIIIMYITDNIVTVRKEYLNMLHACKSTNQI